MNVDAAVDGRGGGGGGGGEAAAVLRPRRPRLCARPRRRVCRVCRPGALQGAGQRRHRPGQLVAQGTRGEVRHADAQHLDAQLLRAPDVGGEVDAPVRGVAVLLQVDDGGLVFIIGFFGGCVFGEKER